MTDEEEVMSDIAMSKIPSKGGLEAKLDALERAENAYFQAKGQTKQQVIQMLPFCSFFFVGR
jgi:bloom syndrome protein